MSLTVMSMVSLCQSNPSDPSPIVLNRIQVRNCRTPVITEGKLTTVSVRLPCSFPLHATKLAERPMNKLSLVWLAFSHPSVVPMEHIITCKVWDLCTTA